MVRRKKKIMLRWLHAVHSTMHPETMHLENCIFPRYPSETRLIINSLQLQTLRVCWTYLSNSSLPLFAAAAIKSHEWCISSEKSPLDWKTKVKMPFLAISISDVSRIHRKYYSLPSRPPFITAWSRRLAEVCPLHRIFICFRAVIYSMTFNQRANAFARRVSASHAQYFISRGDKRCQFRRALMAGSVMMPTSVSLKAKDKILLPKQRNANNCCEHEKLLKQRQQHYEPWKRPEKRYKKLFAQKCRSTNF